MSKDELITEDRYFEILNNPRRRSMIRNIEKHGFLNLDDLKRLVAADEMGKEPNEVAANELKRVHVSFIQQHMPAMLEEDVLSKRDTPNPIIRKGPRFDLFVKALDIAEREPDILLDTD